ncbi:MAG: hypothetical protein INR70_15725, partial [Parafilimonas terrae]|nr:hypothetical protein [Parafilimonas terrae]
MPTFADLIGPDPRLRRSVIDPVTGNAVISPGNEPDPDEIVQRGLLLPVGRTRSGEIVPAAQGPIAAVGSLVAGLPDAPAEAVKAVGFFGDVAAGR